MTDANAPDRPLDDEQKEAIRRQLLSMPKEGMPARWAAKTLTSLVCAALSAVFGFALLGEWQHPLSAWAGESAVEVAMGLQVGWLVTLIMSASAVVFLAIDVPLDRRRSKELREGWYLAAYRLTSSQVIGYERATSTDRELRSHLVVSLLISVAVWLWFRALAWASSGEHEVIDLIVATATCCIWLFAFLYLIAVSPTKERGAEVVAITGQGYWDNRIFVSWDGPLTELISIFPVQEPKPGFQAVFLQRERNGTTIENRFIRWPDAHSKQAQTIADLLSSKQRRKSVRQHTERLRRRRR